MAGRHRHLAKGMKRWNETRKLTPSPSTEQRQQLDLQTSIHESDDRVARWSVGDGRFLTCVHSDSVETWMTGEERWNRARLRLGLPHLGIQVPSRILNTGDTFRAMAVQLSSCLGQVTCRGCNRPAGLDTRKPGNKKSTTEHSPK